MRGGFRIVTARPTPSCRSCANRSSPSCKTRRTFGSTRWAMGNGSAPRRRLIGSRRTVACATRPGPAGSFTNRVMAERRFTTGAWNSPPPASCCKVNCCSSAGTRQAIARYLPKLERCAAFIETRRDPTNNLFLAGPAGNLLAPSYAGWRRPDGTYDKAYLTGLSITYLAALDRLIELEKLAGRPEQAQRYSDLRASAKQGFSN